ncbi:uncharacterized protein A1O9_02472 [Exophiala aquamarina CBS 119918]|uniref:Uncharacterized protein n=1 Tax=Exophiala aquamarina CBS 119918 TaxID=1182545 RepID=A0A072PNJ5_9EURO|nr:uncharacterized protein A1O9_02472 [Exophiala aquamarina CBS 119918]KEF60908.1 hypothetical protein A1O9_02472 [Exophiala aquamarina CBS 119918]
MAATPPLQILSSPATPPSPLHGAKYDRANAFPTRRSTRAATRTRSRNQQSTPEPPRRSPRVEQGANTPRSPKPKSTTAAGLHSPEVTPNTRGSRRVQVMSPHSPDIHSHSSSSKQPPPAESNSHLHPQSSSAATISDGMLPTPVKTPKMKKPIANATTAARALFQDRAQMAAQVAPVQHSPRRSRKSQRFNGFSLESFSAQGDATRGQIQIYTDSRDCVPQVDNDQANPFVERKRDRESMSPQKSVVRSKRRKVSTETRIDPQVMEAIDKGDGMVYVFRGKKVYRRFNDLGDDEEDIDEEDLGLLEHATNGSAEVKPLKTLTRRSIKPKRLFQTASQKRAREEEKEEEAATDIEDHGDVAEDGPSTSVSHTSESSLSRGLRSKKHKLPSSEQNSPKEPGSRNTQKGSPFDSWPRQKPGSRGVAGSQKSKKRGANEVADEDVVAEPTVDAKKART